MGLLSVLNICEPRKRRFIFRALVLIIIAMAIARAIGKAYQHWDDDPDRGALAIDQGEFGENYTTPIYLDQGWSASDSLWFYNTTQGSGLIPYDFFLALEQADSEQPFRANSLIDKYRYLPQKPTFFNPDGLPVGFVKEEYQGKDYIGYTCAACHTGQVNYKNQAIRIDGGPAMADMVGFLTNLQKSMQAAQSNPEKHQRFVAKVLELNNSYSKAPEVEADLKKWTATIALYNNINHSKVKYGYARLDAFGRIYNRVLEHVINRDQVALVLATTTGATGQNLLSDAQVAKVLEGVSETIIGDKQFALIIDRLMSSDPGYPALGAKDMQRIKQNIFNEPNAPVSYPFLWDITHSDYVQWNGLAGNGGVGPLGRNTGEVIGVFGILDWTAKDPGFSLAAWITGQSQKTKVIDFKSSIDLVNLSRLESHLKSLTSPVWPSLHTCYSDPFKPCTEKDEQNPEQQHANQVFAQYPEWQVKPELAKAGRALFAEYCQGCHEVIDRTDWNRIVVAKMSAQDKVGTDPAMAHNSVNYSGYSGNFLNTYLATDVGPASGNVVVQNRAPVVQVLTAATKGVVATPDADKNFIRRGLDWLYVLTKSFADNEIKTSLKAGNYATDTPANPYASLVAYKGRSLNGIWATAPYLHNGSVPTLYDLLLPAKQAGDADEGEYRPANFVVGSREFDPVKVGFRSQGYGGSQFDTGFSFKCRVPQQDGRCFGNQNGGHEYGTIHDQRGMEPLSAEERMALVEYMKTL